MKTDPYLVQVTELVYNMNLDTKVYAYILTAFRKEVVLSLARRNRLTVCNAFIGRGCSNKKAREVPVGQ